VIYQPLSAKVRLIELSAFTVDRQQVSIGQRSDLAAEIRQGVKHGDVVILHPTEQLKTDDRVIPR
jgi:hypothetical protein